MWFHWYGVLQPANKSMGTESRAEAVGKEEGLTEGRGDFGETEMSFI